MGTFLPPLGTCPRGRFAIASAYPAPLPKQKPTTTMAMAGVPHFLRSLANKSTSCRRIYRDTTPLGSLEGAVKGRKRWGPFVERAGREKPARPTPSKIAIMHQSSLSRSTHKLYLPPRPRKHPSNTLQSLSVKKHIGSTSDKSWVPVLDEAKHLLSIVFQEVEPPVELRGGGSSSEVASSRVQIQLYTVEES